MQPVSSSHHRMQIHCVLQPLPQLLLPLTCKDTPCTGHTAMLLARFMHSLKVLDSSPRSCHKSLSKGSFDFLKSSASSLSIESFNLSRMSLQYSKITRLTSWSACVQTSQSSFPYFFGGGHFSSSLLLF